MSDHHPYGPRRLDLADYCRRPKRTILSTPAVSHLIRRHNSFSESHNPGRQSGDFGIKLQRVKRRACPGNADRTNFHVVKGKITSYRIQENAYVDLSSAGFQQCGNIEVEVVDPVDAYASLMEELFDFSVFVSMLCMR